MTSICFEAITNWMKDMRTGMRVREQNRQYFELGNKFMFSMENGATEGSIQKCRVQLM